MTREVRVLVVDDDALVRRALRTFLAADERVTFVGEAVDGSEVISACEALSPHVVLMDIKMRRIGGVEATRRVIGWNPRCRVVALTSFATERRARDVLRAGACRCLVKSSTPEEIVDAIVAAGAGDCVSSPEISSRRPGSAADGGGPQQMDASALSDRERRVVELIARGLSNADIAQELHYAESTVKADIRCINRQWGVENRLQIVLRAAELGIISI